MSQIYDMYRMVKMVKREVIRMDRLEPQGLSDTDMGVWRSSTSSVIKLFVKHRSRAVVSDALHTVRDCIEAGYLEEDTIIDSFGGKLDAVYIMKSGRKLIEKTWFVFPTGLWKAWYEDNGKLFIAFMTSSIGLLILIVTLLTKLIFFTADQ